MGVAALVFLAQETPEDHHDVFLKGLNLNIWKLKFYLIIDKVLAGLNKEKLQT